MKVKLKDVISAIDRTSDKIKFFYSISEENIVEYKEGMSLSDYIALPEERDINNYKIMRYFIYSLENEEKQNVLFEAIRGEGAFKKFREAVASLSLKGKWNRYRSEEYENIARSWCDNNDIRIVEEV